MVGVPAAKRVNDPTKPFNRHSKRRDCGFFALPRQGDRGSRPRHGLMALGMSTLLFACRPLSSSPARRGRFAPMPMRCDRASLLVFRRVLSDRPGQARSRERAPRQKTGLPPARAPASAFPRRPRPLEKRPRAQRRFSLPRTIGKVSAVGGEDANPSDRIFDNARISAKFGQAQGQAQSQTQARRSGGVRPSPAPRPGAAHPAAPASAPARPAGA